MISLQVYNVKRLKHKIKDGNAKQFSTVLKLLNQLPIIWWRVPPSKWLPNDMWICFGNYIGFINIALSLLVARWGQISRTLNTTCWQQILSQYTKTTQSLRKSSTLFDNAGYMLFSIDFQKQQLGDWSSSVDRKQCGYWMILQKPKIRSINKVCLLPATYGHLMGIININIEMMRHHSHSSESILLESIALRSFLRHS